MAAAAAAAANLRTTTAIAASPQVSMSRSGIAATSSSDAELIAIYAPSAQRHHCWTPAADFDATNTVLCAELDGAQHGSHLRKHKATETALAQEEN